jgi:hypothetical protein
VHVNIKALPQSSGKSPKKGQVSQEVYKFCKQAGHCMKDCVEFLSDCTKRGFHLEKDE